MMIHRIRYLSLLAILLLVSSMARADADIRIVKSGQGDLSYKLEGSVCTLTATPADGYCLQVENITVLRTLDGGSSNAPGRAPRIAEPITVTETDPDADPYLTTTYTFQMPDDPYDVEITADFQDNPWVLMVGDIHVTSRNRQDILGDNGTVQFDGKHMLVLNSCNLVNMPIVTRLDSLVIYLKNVNTATVEQRAVIQGNGGKLSFTTEGNTPGTLALATQGNLGVISDFSDIRYLQNLALLNGSPDGQQAEIGTPVTPIVDESNQTETVDVGGDDTAGQDLGNTIINNVLYTLDSDNEDGVDEEENTVVLGTTMVEEDVEEIIETYTPGTDEFAEHFAGLTFMVPAGYGNIYVKAQTGEEGIIHVKIGTGEPYVISGAIDYQDYTFPYVCTEATYVYIYSSSPRKDASDGDSRRAGKKTTVCVGIGSVGVSSNNVQDSNGNTGDTEGASDVVLTDDMMDYDLFTQTLTVTNSEVNVLADDTFADYPFLKYIDLSQTALADVTVNRTQGPFSGVSDQTFIYLPAGNNSDEPNVVVGTVCERVEINGERDYQESETFGLPYAFMAQKVVFSHPFGEQETTTLHLPFSISQEEAAQMGTFYTFAELQNGTVLLTTVQNGVSSHQAYVFKATSNDVALSVQNVQVSMPEDATGARVYMRRAGETATFHGTYEFVEYDGSNDNCYRLVDGDDGQVRFERLKSGDYVSPFECYLVANGQQDVLPVSGDGFTGIRDVRASDESVKQWYGLSGQRLSAMPTQQGVYILGKTKVIIR